VAVASAGPYAFARDQVLAWVSVWSEVQFRQIPMPAPHHSSFYGRPV